MTKGRSHMMKKGYIATSLSLTLLLAGCFGDSRNGRVQGFNQGNPIYGVDPQQLNTRPASVDPRSDVIVPRDENRTGQQSMGNPRADALAKEDAERKKLRAENRQIEALSKAFADIIPGSERLVADETTLWQKTCNAKDASSTIITPANDDADNDQIPRKCEEILGTKPSVFNGWIGNIMVADANVLIFMINGKLEKLEASKIQADKDVAAAARRQLTKMGYDDEGTANKPKFGRRVKNTLLGTSILDQLVGLWISLGKQFYRSDIPIYQELYALLSDPERVDGDEIRGSKVFLNPQMHPNDPNSGVKPLPDAAVVASYYSDVRQPFSLMKGGTEQQVFVNHEDFSGNVSITDLGGAGSNMQLIGDLKNKAVIAIYEGFAERNFDVQLMTVQNNQGFVQPIEGLAAFYAGGNLEAFSAQLGSGLGSLKDIFKKSGSLKTKQSNAETAGSVYAGNSMAAIFINLERAPVVPINFFMKNTEKTPAGALQFEMLPQHVSRICPTSKEERDRLGPLGSQNDVSANRLITFEALKYCSGYEKYDTLTCPPATPNGGFNAPCQVKEAIKSTTSVQRDDGSRMSFRKPPQKSPNNKPVQSAPARGDLDDDNADIAEVSDDRQDSDDNGIDG